MRSVNLNSLNNNIVMCSFKFISESLLAMSTGMTLSNKYFVLHSHHGSRYKSQSRCSTSGSGERSVEAHFVRTSVVLEGATQSL